MHMATRPMAECGACRPRRFRFEEGLSHHAMHARLLWFNWRHLTR